MLCSYETPTVRQTQKESNQQSVLVFGLILVQAEPKSHYWIRRRATNTTVFRSSLSCSSQTSCIALVLRLMFGSHSFHSFHKQLCLQDEEVFLTYNSTRQQQQHRSLNQTHGLLFLWPTGLSCLRKVVCAHLSIRPIRIVVRAFKFKILQ